MTASIYEENRSNDIQLAKNIRENIELMVHKNLLNTNYEILRQRKTVLKEEQMKMNNVNYAVWALEDSICNEVWSFSLEHKFNIIFKQYPAITEVIKCHNCKYSVVPYNYAQGVNTIKEDKVMELKNEIDNINNQITFIRNKDIELDITNAMFILDNLKSFSEDILNLIRLVNSLENIIYKKLKTDKELKDAGNYLKNHPITIVGKTVATSSNNLAKIDKSTKLQCLCMKNNIQFGKFIFKKQSIISLKLKHQKDIGSLE